MQSDKLVVDERKKRKLDETATVVLGLFYVVCTLEIVLKLIITHNYLSILGELLILLSVTYTFLIVQRFNKNYFPSLPRKNNGEELSSEVTRKSKLKRLFIYVKESIILAIGLTTVSTVMDHFFKQQIITINLKFIVSQFNNIIIGFVVVFICNFIWKERKIKTYNKWNNKLDE